MRQDLPQRSVSLGFPASGHRLVANIKSYGKKTMPRIDRGVVLFRELFAFRFLTG